MIRPVVAFGLGLFLIQGCAGIQQRQAVDPLPHFFQVDAQLSRGGQPTDEGFRQLARMGVRTIVNLRAEDEANRLHERQVVESLGMRWIDLPMRAYWRPTDAQITTFLQLASDASSQPIFIHCQRGKDRAGVMAAIYRIVYDGWEPARAYAEARSLGMTPLNPLLHDAVLHQVWPYPTMARMDGNPTGTVHGTLAPSPRNVLTREASWAATGNRAEKPFAARSLASTEQVSVRP